MTKNGEIIHKIHFLYCKKHSLQLKKQYIYDEGFYHYCSPGGRTKTLNFKDIMNYWQNVKIIDKKNVYKPFYFPKNILMKKLFIFYKNFFAIFFCILFHYKVIICIYVYSILQINIKYKCNKYALFELVTNILLGNMHYFFKHISSIIFV